MKIKYDFLKKEDKNFPPIVHVLTTNVCNIRCIHCPLSNPYNLIPKYKPEHISFSIWKKVVDEVCQYDSTLRITPDGEPLVVPDWIKQIDYALKKRVKRIALNTNGILMEKNKMEVLFQNTNTEIAVEFSIDAFWKTSYEKIRVGSDYIRLLKNIFNFIYEVKRRKNKNIKTLVSIIIQPELEKKEYEMFVKFWRSLVDKVITRRYVDIKGIMPRKPEVERFIKKRWPCLVPFTRAVVTYEGEIRFCPDDWRKETTIGNIKENSIKDIWNGSFMKELRMNHLNRNFDKAHRVCSKCNDWKVIEWGYDYTKALRDLKT